VDDASRGLFLFLSHQPVVTIFLVLGLGHVVGRASIGMLSVGSTAGSLLVALLVGVLAFEVFDIRFQIPDLLGTLFLALFIYAIGLRVGPQFVEGMRQEGMQLVVLVIITTTVAFALAYGGSTLLGLAPGVAPGILAGSNTISAVMGVATSAVDDGLFTPPAGMTPAEVKANIAAAYSMSYLPSVFLIVLLVRHLPGLFGIDPIRAAKKAEQQYGAKGHALSGTSHAFDIGMPAGDVRVFRVANDEFIGRHVQDVFERLFVPVLRLTRDGVSIPIDSGPVLHAGDLLTVAGKVDHLLQSSRIGPEVADDEARRLDIDQAEIVLTSRTLVGKTLDELRRGMPTYRLRLRALFRSGHEIPILPKTTLARHDMLRVIGPAESIARLGKTLGLVVRPSTATDIVTLGFAIAAGYAVGLITIPVAGVPIGLGTMGGIVVAGMVVAIVRAVNPALGGPMPEGARAFLEILGVDLFVTTLGLTVAPALRATLSRGSEALTLLLLGAVCSTLPTFISWLVGLYVFRMDPIVLAGAVAGARNSTTAMRAISDQAKSQIPSFGYPVPYALSTVVFLIYGYVAMLLS
jgi:putative transport protein